MAKCVTQYQIETQNTIGSTPKGVNYLLDCVKAGWAGHPELSAMGEKSLINNGSVGESLTLLPSGLSGQGISFFNQSGTSSQALVLCGIKRKIKDCDLERALSIIS